MGYYTITIEVGIYDHLTVIVKCEREPAKEEIVDLLPCSGCDEDAFTEEDITITPCTVHTLNNNGELEP